MKKVESEEKLKSIELYLLDEFVKICNKYNLQYYLVGGSALGAVRHNGFIPWDDDIDVALPREEYEKFLSVAKGELDEKNIFLQSYETDKKYINDFAKLRMNGTTFRENSCKKLKIHHGVYIDIFPIDGYPENPKEIKRLEHKKKLSKYFLSRHYVLQEKPRRFRWLKLFVTWVALGFKTDKQILKSLEKAYKKTSYKSASTVACFGGAWGKLEYCPKEHYGKGVLWEFEGRKVVIPELYDAYLTQKYNDYTILPPLEKRVSHHGLDVIDLENSYEIYN